MVAKKFTDKKTKRKQITPPDESDSKKKKKKKASVPPFIKHYKSSTSSDATPYKVGDTKEWNNEKWFFCDCPNHRDGARWHTFSADECRTRKRWLAKKQKEATANLAEEKSDDEDIPDGDDEENKEQSEPDKGSITAILANAMNLVGDNNVLKDIIADALTQADQM